MPDTLITMRISFVASCYKVNLSVLFCNFLKLFLTLMCQIFTSLSDIIESLAEPQCTNLQ